MIEKETRGGRLHQVGEGQSGHYPGIPVYSLLPEVLPVKKEAQNPSDRFKVILCHVLKVEAVEMREPAVPARYREMPRAYDQIMGSCYPAVPARCLFGQFPDGIFPNPGEDAGCINILGPGHKDPGCPAIIARNLRLVRDCLDDLVGILFTVIAVGAVSGEDKPVAHGR